MMRLMMSGGVLGAFGATKRIGFDGKPACAKAAGAKLVGAMPATAACHGVTVTAMNLRNLPARRRPHTSSHPGSLGEEQVAWTASGSTR